MVIGKERTNWHDEHGSSCTCVACTNKYSAQRRFKAASEGRKVGRNEVCPCGSGKKFKKCHYKL